MTNSKFNGYFQYLVTKEVMSNKFSLFNGGVKKDNFDITLKFVDPDELAEVAKDFCKITSLKSEVGEDGRYRYVVSIKDINLEAIDDDTRNKACAAVKRELAGL